MKKIKTKIGVVITTYTRKEIDDRVDASLEKEDSDEDFDWN